HVIHPDESESIHYIHKDHLGSWHTITDENGNLLQELSFDAWGARRNPQTWDAFTGTPPAPLYDRGFTGHEHLYAFGLINMNGRMYDPIVSRMLSPDNFIQSPDFSQSFNRYSYAWNNPLVYTDPDGEWLFMAIAVGVMFNVGIQAASGNINNVGDFFIAAGIGALSGATGAYAAGALSVSMGLTASGAMSGAVWGATAGFTSGFISGAGNSWMNGNGFLNGVKDGLITGGISGATGGIVGGLSGGITATRNNKDFWSGMPNLNGRNKLAHHIPNAELNIGNIKRSKILPFYEDSELYYDGDILTWRDYFSDGSYQVRDTWSAWSGGRNPKSSDVFGGRIPNGDWDLVSIQEGGPSSYERFKVKFYGDLEPRFSLPPARTGGFEIHPDGGRFGTGGCIGLQVNKESLLKFYNMSETYIHRLGFLRVIVNY
ncbi:MAG: hypothetical protein K0B11_22610, partial [Mariniphaga sp.]|nr:hypothetical protein [Mariniphaga sp.]